MTKKAKLQNRQIRRVYRQTGGVTQTGQTITFRQFKNRVLARAKSEDITIRKAAIKEKNTESFTSAAERSRTNLLDKIREKYDQGPNSAWEDLKRINRQIRDPQGHFTSMRSNMVWDRDLHGYVIGDDFTGMYLIDVTNSPEDIFVTKIG